MNTNTNTELSHIVKHLTQQVNKLIVVERQLVQQVFIVEMQQSSQQQQINRILNSQQQQQHQIEIENQISICCNSESEEPPPLICVTTAATDYTKKLASIRQKIKTRKNAINTRIVNITKWNATDNDKENNNRNIEKLEKEIIELELKAEQFRKLRKLKAEQFRKLRKEQKPKRKASHKSE
jgi:hypothetical protein